MCEVCKVTWQIFGYNVDNKSEAKLLEIIWIKTRIIHSISFFKILPTQKKPFIACFTG